MATPTRLSNLVGAFFKYRPIANLQLGLNVYNLFNTFAAPGAAGFVGGSNNTLVNVGAAQGRAIKGFGEVQLLT